MNVTPGEACEDDWAWGRGAWGGGAGKCALEAGAWRRKFGVTARLECAFSSFDACAIGVPPGAYPAAALLIVRLPLAADNEDDKGCEDEDEKPLGKSAEISCVIELNKLA